MFRKLVLLGVCLLLPMGFVLAQGKEASGRVKSLTADSIVVTDSAGKDWTFVVDSSTSVTAKGATHKTSDVKDAGKATKITDFVKVNESVAVKYADKDGKMIASEVRVK